MKRPKKGCLLDYHDTIWVVSISLITIKFWSMRTSYIPLTNRLIGLRDRNIYVRKFGPIYNPFSLMF